MTRILFKATLATLLSIAASLLVAISIVPAFGGVVDGTAWLMCILCPIFVAFPVSAYTFWQSDRLKVALAALAATHQELADTHAKLMEKSRRDPMTGFLNRETFFQEVEACRRHATAGALLLIDADHFKSVNDRFGHLVGDDALLEISAAIERGVRAGDLIGRIGGEEFAVLLLGASAREAMQVAERIRRQVEDIQFSPGQSGDLPLTVSIGGTGLSANATLSDLMRAADKQLYAAKKSGRNRAILDTDAKVAA